MNRPDKKAFRRITIFPRMNYLLPGDVQLSRTVIRKEEAAWLIG